MATVKEQILAEKGGNDAGPGSPTIVRASFSDTMAVDAFQRLRVSNPITLFDSRQFTGDNSLLWENSTPVGTASVSAQTARSSVYLTNGGTASGAKIVRQSRYNFLYQAGRSFAVFQTFVLGTATSNVRKRVGFFNEDRAGHGDGIFLEQNGSNGEYLTLRTSTSGTASDANKVARSAWFDRFDGLGGKTNPSGINLDFSKTQIMVIDLQYLGVGRVRVAFDVDGILFPAYEFKNANVQTVAYMKTPNLNLRYEIENTGVAGGTVNLEHICAAVMVEGGVDPGSRGLPWAGPATAIAGVGVTTRRPILSVRAKTLINSIRNRGHIFPRAIELLVQTNSAYIELVLNGTLTGGAGAWTDLSATQSLVEYNTDRTGISGGRVIRAFYCAPGTGSNRQDSTRSDFMDLPLVLTDLLDVQDVLSIVATAQTGTSTVAASMCGQEYY